MRCHYLITMAESAKRTCRGREAGFHRNLVSFPRIYTRRISHTTEKYYPIEVS